MAEPTKAYYVEKIQRTVTTFLVYADSAEDAKRRAVMEGDAINSETFGTGKWGKVRRAKDEDREPEQDGCPECGARPFRPSAHHPPVISHRPGCVAAAMDANR